MDNQVLKIFQHEFENNLRLLSHPVCQRCDAKVKNPLLPWIIGNKYWDTKERVLIVGKPHRGDAGKIFPSGIVDSTTHLDWLMNCHWPYWRYTRNILEKVYGIEDPWSYVCFTNLIKCTNVREGDSSNDMTSCTMAKNCIQDLGVIYYEIKRLEPKTVIFYTYSLYRELLRDLPAEINAKTLTTIKPEDYRVKCGEKYLGWWERQISTSWSDNVRVLVTGHPERMKRDAYVPLLANWIKL